MAAMARADGAARALGIDVSSARGLDLVLLDGSPQPAFVRERVAVADLARVLPPLAADVVAVDAPSRWGLSGGSRDCERALRRLGIQSYGTPSDPARRDDPFYSWMKVGVAVYEALGALGFATYRGGDVARCAAEVYPHASSVALAGVLPPRAQSRVERREWRAEVLERAGVATASLATNDAVDAALAALTGLMALRGDFTALGRAEDGFIVVPGRVPMEPYRPDQGARRRRAQPRLPGLSPCACEDPACRDLTRQEFAPGHDAKRKRLLWERALSGREALDELQRRGWELPRELRGRRRTS